MPKLPQLFFSRLRAQTPSTLDPVSAPHPDADTLAAFAERVLPAPERAAVALHLAACADCRATLELAFGLDSLPAPGEHASTAPGPWFGLRLWRIALPALAAGLALLLLLPSFNQREPLRIAAVRPLPHPENQPSPASVVQPPPAPAAAIRGPERARESSAPASLVAKLEPLPSPPSPPAPLSAQEGVIASRQALGQASAAAPPPPPPISRSVSQSVQVVAAAESVAPIEPASAPSHQAAPAPAPAGQSGLTQTNVEVVGGLSQAPPATTHFAPTAGASQDLDARQQVTALKSQPVPVTAEVTQYAAKSRAPLRKAAALTQQAAHWEICRQLQASQHVHGSLCQVSAGGDRRVVTIDPSVEFFAVASRGAEVWAGGAGGALYSSTDNGLHWQRSIISATGPGQNQPPPLTESIVTIDLSLPERVLIATSTGETWIFQDGVWRRKAD